MPFKHDLHENPNENPSEQLKAQAALFDRFARFYDADYRDYDDDLSAIAQLAEEAEGPVLELGCGTGRVMLSLALLGHSVTGVDLSPGLLAVAGTKLTQAGVINRTSLLQDDLRTFSLPQNDFGLAVCTSNTLMHFPTPSEQVAVLQRAHHHLRAGGLIFVDLFNPDLPRLIEVNGLMELADRWQDEQSGAQVLKWSIRSLDIAEQLQETTFIYEEIFPTGEVQKTLCPFPMRYLWRNEAELMLEKAGFTVAEVWGDFDGSDYDGFSEHLILLAKK